MAALAIIFGYVEMLLPVFVTIPGMKLGLANLVTVFVLYTYRTKEAAIISLIRIVVIGFLFCQPVFDFVQSGRGSAEPFVYGRSKALSRIFCGRRQYFRRRDT